MSALKKLLTPRIYLSDNLQQSSVVSLKDKAHHHLSRVLRAKVGQSLALFNGKGGEYHGQIKRIEKKQTIIEVKTFHATAREPNIAVHLAPVVLSGTKMDLIIQKATELGVHQFTPLLSLRQTPQDATRLSKRYSHWQQIIIHASEQCGRNQLMILNPAVSLETFNEQVTGQHQMTVILNMQARNSLSTLIKTNTPICLVIGPEGGFSEDELKLAQKQNWHSANLGPTVLRAETAAIAGCTLAIGLSQSARQKTTD